MKVNSSNKIGILMAVMNNFILPFTRFIKIQNSSANFSRSAFISINNWSIVHTDRQFTIGQVEQSVIIRENNLINPIYVRSLVKEVIIKIFNIRHIRRDWNFVVDLRYRKIWVRGKFSSGYYFLLKLRRLYNSFSFPQ